MPLINVVRDGLQTGTAQGEIGHAVDHDDRFLMLGIQDDRRPRQRVHPAKPKVGIRASHADEIWHVDTTPIRLLDGGVEKQLERSRIAARQLRMEANRAQTCRTCEELVSISS